MEIELDPPNGATGYPIGMPEGAARGYTLDDPDCPRFPERRHAADWSRRL
jgi:hypothetical protein